MDNIYLEALKKIYYIVSGDYTLLDPLAKQEILKVFEDLKRGSNNDA